MHDDIALIIKTTQGLIVLLGCGHSGPVNTLKHAMRITGINKIHAVMGGMHLHRAPDRKVQSITYNLINLKPEVIEPEPL